MPEMRMLAGRYQLVEAAGRGSMGTVWRARDQLLNRQVAVKEVRLPPGLTQEQRSELTERTMREARTAAQVSHQAVITVFDVVAEDGRPWIIMEFVDARSLEEIVEQEGPLSPRMAAELGYDLLSALRAAHNHGVLHRDVKPSNVLITEKGRVVLTDFGIAKQQTDATLTRTGMVIGSPGYTAPERARGEHTGPESDLWSLGATLYYAVEGRPAYERDSVMATISALLTEDVDPPQQAGPVTPILEGLLAKDPKERLKPERASAMLRKIAQPHAPDEEEAEQEAEEETNPRETQARAPRPASPPSSQSASPPSSQSASQQPSQSASQQPSQSASQPARSAAGTPAKPRPRPPGRPAGGQGLSGPGPGGQGRSGQPRTGQAKPPPGRPKQPAKSAGQAAPAKSPGQAGRRQPSPPDPERTVALPWMSKSSPDTPPRSQAAPGPSVQQPSDESKTVAIEGMSGSPHSGAPTARDGLMTGVFGIARPPAPTGGEQGRKEGRSRASMIMIFCAGVVLLAIILGFILLISRG